jgi:hypothetical protein
LPILNHGILLLMRTPGDTTWSAKYTANARNLRPRIGPDQWAEQFTSCFNTRWVASNRFCTRVAALYRNFREYCESQKDWAPDEEGFTALLTQAGLRLVRIRDETWIAGLGFICDIEAMRQAYGRKKRT